MSVHPNLGRAYHHRIQRNATESPLLRLPGELRNRIFRLVVGDRLIHLCLVKINRAKVLHHSVCKSDMSEDDLYTEFVQHGVLTSHVHSNENPPFNTDGVPIERGHSQCMDMPERDDRMSLQLLKVCLQAYEEANYLLLSTNTFSFQETNTLHFFLKTLNASQRKKLITLRIVKYGTADSRMDSLKMRTSTFLRNAKFIRKLHIIFSTKHWPFATDRADTWSKIAMLSSEPLGAMKCLDLKHVTVVIEEDCLVKPDSDVIATQKREAAEALRQKLLNPQGSEVYAREQAIEASNQPILSRMESISSTMYTDGECSADIPYWKRQLDHLKTTLQVVE